MNAVAPLRAVVQLRGLLRRGSKASSTQLVCQVVKWAGHTPLCDTTAMQPPICSAERYCGLLSGLLLEAMSSRSLASQVVFVSSKMSSVSRQQSGGSNYGYRMSKAALNMAAMCLASDLQPEGVAVMLLHPGAVATDLFAAFHGCRPGDSGSVRPATAAHGPLTVQQSAAHILQRIDELTLETTGGFVDAPTGERLLF